MICGLGLDVVEIERIKKTLENTGERFIKRIYTPMEVEYCENRKIGRIESYAARFAAKEAMAKALGCGIGADLEFKEIEVYNNEQGRPFIRLLNRAAVNFCNKNFHISLTHTELTAAAVVVVEEQC